MYYKKYDRFYDWYKTNHTRFPDDKTKICIAQFQKTDNKGKAIAFFHNEKQHYHVKKVPNVLTVEKHHSTYPLGIYVFFNPFEGQKHQDKKDFISYSRRKERYTVMKKD